MRILMYTNTALPKLGGQEIIIDALARQFVALGYEPVVLAPWRPSQGRFDPASVPYRVAWHPRFLSTRHFVALYGRWIAKLHRACRFDVVHCHGTYPAGYVAASCAAVDDLPLVVTSHGDDLAPQGLYDRKPELRPRYRFALERADAAIAISNYTEQLYRQTGAAVRRIVPLPNGVDVRRFAAPAPRPDGIAPAIRAGDYFLFVGRLDRRKGIDVLLEAMALLKDRCRLDLVVVGRGPERDALGEQANRLGLAGRVHFAGAVDDSQKTWLLQNGAATIMPSRGWEGFPLVFVETFASGRPLIASAIPGLDAAVEHNETGLLVAPDAPGELADAMARLAGDRELARRLGAAARQEAEQFDCRHVAARHLELYTALLAEKRRGRSA